jgi:hypothetical protein
MYRNEGKPMEEIVSIPFLAQCVMAILLQRPADARARPSSLLKNDDDYGYLFSPKYDVKLYLASARIGKAVQTYLRGQDTLLPKDKNNLIFYVVMHVAGVLAKSKAPTVPQLAAMAADKIDDKTVEQSLAAVKALYDKLGATDQVAKGAVLPAEVKGLLAALFP